MGIGWTPYAGEPGTPLPRSGLPYPRGTTFDRLLIPLGKGSEAGTWPILPYGSGRIGVMCLDQGATSLLADRRVQLIFRLINHRSTGRRLMLKVLKISSTRIPWERP